MNAIYCKSCKRVIKPLDYWFLFDNAKFTNRIAIIGKCSKCKQDILLLTETRKNDNKIFNQLEVGKKANKLAELCLEQIDYTLEDSKEKKSNPSKWTYGKAIKDTKNKRYNIMRVDFHNRSEVIGYIDFNDKEQKIREFENNEYRRI